MSAVDMVLELGEERPAKGQHPPCHGCGVSPDFAPGETTPMKVTVVEKIKDEWQSFCAGCYVRMGLAEVVP